MRTIKVGGKRVSTEIPTSSQSDIAFLLIIFFVITTSFALTVKMVSVQQIDKVLITKDGYRINGSMTPEEELPAVLVTLNRPNLLVEIQKGVKYQHVLTLIGMIPATGAKISIRMEK